MTRSLIKHNVNQAQKTIEGVAKNYRDYSPSSQENKKKLSPSEKIDLLTSITLFTVSLIAMVVLMFMFSPK